MKPILQLIAKDHHQDREGWSWMAVIHFTGDLALNEEGNVSEEQFAEIYQFLATYDIHVRGTGNGIPGQPFSNEPWIQFLPNHLIITQSGGLDI